MATHVSSENYRYADTASARTCEMIVALGDWRGERPAEAIEHFQRIQASTSNRTNSWVRKELSWNHVSA